MPKLTPTMRVLFPSYHRTVLLGVACVFTLLSSILITSFHPASTDAATQSTINFQARLQKANGAIVPDGYYNVQFKLYDAATGGANPWMETYYDSNGVTAGQDNRVRVQNGYLSVALGSQTAFPSTINWDQQLYLTMNIGGTTQTATPTYDGEMDPRLALTAVPYAFRAGQAKTLADGNSSLNFTNPSNSNTLSLPDESGTLCVQSSANCGFALSSGSGSYIQNGTSVQTGANFNIAGNGTIGGTLTVSGGASIVGGLNNNSGGITNAGAISGVTTLSASGTITTTGDISSAYSSTHGLTRTVPTTVNNEVDLGAFNTGLGGASFNITVSVNTSNFSVAKSYVVPTAYNQTGGTWQLVQPVADSGPYIAGGSDVALDVNVSNGSVSFRLRRTAGTNAGTAQIMIRQDAGSSNTFTPSTATSSVTAPTTTFGSTALTQLSGNVGVGTTAPNYKLDVNGDINVAAGSAYRIGGTTICTVDGCLAAASSTSYIVNSASTQVGNLNVQSASTGTSAGVFQGAAGQTADIFKVLDSGNSKLLAVTTTGVSTTGTLTVGGDTSLSGALTVAGNITSTGGVFTGNGSGLTSLNASNLTSGMLASGRLSGTYSSALTFSSASNSFTGSGAGLTALNASNLSSGTVASARLSGSYTGIVGTGALNAGSITSGFGAINNGNSGITSTGTITGATVNATSGFQVNGVALASSNLSDGSNLAKLNGTQTFSGANTFTNATTVKANSATAFRVQDAGGNSVVTVDTVGGTLFTNTIDSFPGTGSGTPPAITQTLRVNAASPGMTHINTAPFTPSGTFTPNANTLLVANVYAGESSQASNMASNGSDLTISGGGLTWVPITGTARAVNTNSDVAIRSFYAVVDSTPPSNMQVTVGASGTDIFAYTVHVNEFANVNLSSPIAGATSANRSSTADNQTFTLSLGATPSSGDVKIGAVSMQAQNPGAFGNNGYATPSGWTTYAQTSTTPYYSISSQVNGQTGSTSTTVNFALGNLNTPPQDTSYSAFIIKQTTTGGTPPSVLSLGGTNATSIVLGGAGTSITIPSLASCYLTVDASGVLGCGMGADVAETYYSKDASVQPGDLVSIDSSMHAGVRKTTAAYQRDTLGVISTKPGLVLGDDTQASGTPVKLALVGRVPVKVTTMNGAIRAGDYLTASAIPGVAMKATRPGIMIGRALEDFEGGTGTVMAFIGTGYGVPNDSELQLSGGTAGETAQGASLQGTDTVAADSGSAESDAAAGDPSSAVVLQGQINDLQTQTSSLQQQVDSLSTFLNTDEVRAHTLTVTGDAIIDGALVVAGTAQLQQIELAGDTHLTGTVNTRQATIKQFTASKDIVAGSVVVLDDTPGNEGRVTTSTTVNDLRVIGVAVTDAQAGEDVDIAISGWVQVKVDHHKNADGNELPLLTAGRLLTTSSTEGTAYAPAVPSVGSILGKTTSSQDDQNMIWLLITLQ